MVSELDLGRRVVADGDLEAEPFREGENSNILALFGGTTGPGVSSPFDSCSASRGSGADDVGIIRGAKDLGDSGCLCGVKSRGFGVALRLSSFAWPRVFEASGIDISARSSNAGPATPISMFSPKTCCRQLFPGALLDRSCSGGRPGTVARLC
jgi:hypothetical protein